MFDVIAPRYDFLNHLLSAGIDRHWRTRAIRSLGLTGRERVLFVSGINPADEKPWPARLARAAAYNPVTDTWRRIAPLPAERILCQRLSVSRPTLRSAVDELVNNGMLVRQHGRGTFVAPAKITQEMVSDDRTMVLPQAAGTFRC